MIIPTVHLNGTSKDELLLQLKNAYNAIREAQHMLVHAAPHGRDYYPQGSDVILQAMVEHEQRHKKLSSVAIELETIAMAIQDGGHRAA